jgi:hypothetical protein
MIDIGDSGSKQNAMLREDVAYKEELVQTNFK